MGASYSFLPAAVVTVVLVAAAVALVVARARGGADRLREHDRNDWPDEQA